MEEPESRCSGFLELLFMDLNIPNYLKKPKENPWNMFMNILCDLEFGNLKMVNERGGDQQQTKTKCRKRVVTETDGL